MKLTISFLVLVVALLSVGKAENNGEESIFERSFKILHGEPELPLVGQSRAIATNWIQQQLDHFDEANEKTWEMRYMSNDEYYEEGGPLFIYVGGEWTISAGAITSGHIVDMAKEHKGYLFYTEHRYYGESRPTDNTSNENIKYLHVLQALADLAHFIRTMKSTIAGMSESKAILVGGSYSATMVTWFRKLYPELATGCWASSAPLFAKVNFLEYKEVTGQSINLVGGAACYNRIQNGIAEMESLFSNKRGAEVKAMLKLCNNFVEDNDMDLWTLFSEISDIFAGVVQTHNSGNIERVCTEIMQGENDLDGVTNYLLGEFGSNNCNDLSYKNILSSIIESDFGNGSMRQWIYQTCNEYGWYQTSASSAQPFGTKFPMLYYTTMCADAYGEQFTNEFIHNQIEATNVLFGGLEPEVDNVYMSHGQLDPWSAMGIKDEKQATIIPLHAHCKDLGSISPSDTAELRASKEKVAQLVREWLGSTNAQAPSATVLKARQYLKKLIN